MSYDLERRRQEKMREIERRIFFMRAASPPKDLLRVTSRSNVVEIQKSLKGSRSSTTIGDQLIEKGILDNEYYNTLKETIRNSPTSSMKRSASRSSSFSPQSSFSFTSSSPYAIPQTEEIIPSRHSTPHEHAAEHHPNLQETNWNEHPMVRELACRGLTSAASKRKLQATVKREVEKSLAASAAANDFKGLPKF